MNQEILNFLNKLNDEYLKLHQTHENTFWKFYMWDHSLQDQTTQTQIQFEKWRSDKKHLEQIEKYLNNSDQIDSNLIQRLNYWKKFFEIYYIPDELKQLKNKIIDYENELSKKQESTKTWYIDPYTWKFIEMDKLKMRQKMQVEKDEKLRKALFDWLENYAKLRIKDLIWLIKHRNEFAKKLWYKNFYEYKAQIEEQISSNEIFEIFDKLYDKLKVKLEEIKEAEKTKYPNLTKPWNFWFILAWDLIKEEDKYFPLETIIDKRWQSYTALWIDYQWAKLQLDLLARQWKYSNWFCHIPTPVYFKNWKRQPAQINFTCNAIYWQVWSGKRAGITLFHEWGHAAHFSNMNQQDIILNTEYAPASTAWAETQSMFLDTMFESIERTHHYATDLQWNKFPFELFEKRLEKTYITRWLWILSIAWVVKFEEILYNLDETKLNEKYVEELAKQISIDYFWYSQPTLHILRIPHIYSRDSSAYYHWYWMAELMLFQVRKYFLEKDWFIVNNPNVWKTLKKWREYWSTKNFNELLKIIIWQTISPDAYIENVFKDIETIKKEAKQTIQKVPKFNWEINLNAKIHLVNWYTEIANNVDTTWKEMIQKRQKYIKNQKI